MSQKYAKTGTMSRRPDPRNNRTRSAIKAALVDLLASQPFDQLLVRDIVAGAGIGNATFFRHYRDKAQVLEEVAQDFFEQASGAMLPALGDRHSDLGARHLCRFVDEHRVVYTALLTGGAGGQIRADFVEKTAEQAFPLAAGQPVRLPGRLAVIYPLSAIVTILAWWLGEVPETPPDEVAQLIARLVFKPMMEYQ